MVEPEATSAPTDGGQPPAPETPPVDSVPVEEDFSYLDAAQAELMEALDDPAPTELTPAVPPPAEPPVVAEPPPPAVPPAVPVVPEPPPAVPPPVTAEDENKALRAQVAALTDQVNRMVGLEKVGAYEPPPPVPGAPIDPAVAPPPAPGVYTPPVATAPPAAAAAPITAPMVTVAPEVLPEGFAEMAEPLTRISQSLVNQMHEDVNTIVDQKLNTLVQSSRYVAGVNDRFYAAYPALSPYKKLVAQIAAPYERNIIDAPARGLDASVYFAPIAQQASAYLVSQGIAVDPTHAAPPPPGPTPTPGSPHPAAVRATTHVGGSRGPAPAAGGPLSQTEYMNLLG